MDPLILSQEKEGGGRPPLPDWKKIPAIIKNVDSRESLEMALIENIQREEL